MEKLTDEQIQQSIAAMEGYGFYTDEYIMEHLQASEEHLNDPDFEAKMRELIVDFVTTGIIEDFQNGWRTEWFLNSTNESIFCLDYGDDCSWLYTKLTPEHPEYQAGAIFEHNNVRNLIDLIDDDVIIDFWLTTKMEEYQ